MKWSDISFDPSRRILRQFAGCWLVVFLALGANQYFLKHSPSLGVALSLLAVALGVPGLIWPKLLRWVFVGWMVLAFPIGWAISLLMLLLLYYVVLTPIACFFRLIGRDILGRQPGAERKTLWQPKETSLDVRSYFRQY
jgi:hypothetical protein